MIDQEMAAPTFWEDSRKAQALVQERADLARTTGRFKDLAGQAEDLRVLFGEGLERRATNEAQFGIPHRCHRGGTRQAIDDRKLADNAARTDNRNSDPLKSEKNGTAMNSAPAAVPCRQNSEAAVPESTAASPTARLNPLVPG